VDRAPHGANLEVLDEPAVGADGLRSHAGTRANEILTLDLRYEPARGRGEASLAQGARHLVETEAPIPAGEPPEPGEPQGLSHVADIDTTPLVALACKREDCIRPDVDHPVDPSREVNTEKRELRIGDGIHESAHQARPRRNQLPILTAERDDTDAVGTGGPAHRARDLVGMQAGAGDNPAGFDRPARGLDDEPRRALLAGNHLATQTDDRAGLLDLGGELATHGGVVDDPGVEHVERGEAGDMRLAFAQGFGPEHLDAHTVGVAPSLQLGKARLVVVVERDDDLAADRVVDAAVSAVLHHRDAARGAEPGLGGPGLVVDAGVDHTRVATTLVCADRRFLFNHNDGALGVLAQDRACRCQPHDPCTHDKHVCPVHPNARYCGKRAAAETCARSSLGEGRDERDKTWPMAAGGWSDMTRAWDRSADAGRRLDGRVAVVTGAGSDDGLTGIGVATAVLFATQGAKVGVVDISHERADATRRMIDDVGGECVVAVGDLTNPDDNARCIAEVARAFGRLDTLVNSAAIAGATGSPVDTDLAQWNATLDLNITAAMVAAKHAIPHLRAVGGGAIVNISSIAGTHGFGSGAYAASKAALIGLTKDWAYLHGRDGIRVNCLVLGHVYAPMGATGGEAQREPRRRAGLLGSEGTAWDVAWPAVFLASEESRWITGVALPVDAGTTASTALGVGTLNDQFPV
jgi:NAD(P)-dependent dehydrogenase (short-subunit alcohol dehydrogenase family)